MRFTSSLVFISFFLLHILICGAYGSRLGKFVKESSLKVEVVPEGGSEWASKGNIRKLITSTPMAKHIKENGKVEENKDDLRHDKSSSSANASSRNTNEDHHHGNHEVVHHKGEDYNLTNIIEMDYSPAVRKTPIHN